MEKPRPGKPEVGVKPHSYKATRQELHKPIDIPTTPERLAAAVLRQVKVVKDNGG